MDTTTTVQTPSGLPITVTATIHYGTMIRLDVAIPSRGLRGDGGCLVAIAHPEHGGTHVIGGLDIAGKRTDIVLGPEAAESVERIMAAAQAQIDARIDGMISHRTMLVAQMDALLDVAHDEREHAVESASATGICRRPADRTAEIAAARAALADFDAAHPEVRAEIERRKSEMLDRHIWD